VFNVGPPKKKLDDPFKRSKKFPKDKQKNEGKLGKRGAYFSNKGDSIKKGKGNGNKQRKRRKIYSTDESWLLNMKTRQGGNHQKKVSEPTKRI